MIIVCHLATSFILANGDDNDDAVAVAVLTVRLSMQLNLFYSSVVHTIVCMWLCVCVCRAHGHLID